MIFKTIVSAAVIITLTITLPNAIIGINGSPEVLFYPEIGLIFEPNVQVMTYNQFAYIPLIYRIPSLHALYRDHLNCTSTEVGEDIILTWQEYIESILPEFEIRAPVEFNLTKVRNPDNIQPTHQRRKRFIASLLSVVSGGMSIWNRVSLEQLSGKIEELKVIIERNQIELQKLMITNERVKQEIKHVVMTTHLIFDQLKTNQRTLACAIDNNRQAIQFLSTLGTIIPSGFIRAVEWALQGKVSPDLFPISHLIPMIQARLDLSNSVLTTQPGLFYEIATFVVTTIQNKPGMISGVIIIPNIMRLSPIYSHQVGTVSFYHNGHPCTIDMNPDAVLDWNNKQAWSISEMDCIRASSSIICPQVSIYRKQDHCATGIIFHNTTQSCTIRNITKQTISDDIFVLSSGIMVGANLNQWEILKFRLHRSTLVSTTYHSNQTVIYVDSTIGDYLVVNNKTFSVNNTVMLVMPQITIKKSPKVQLHNVDLSDLRNHSTSQDTYWAIPHQTDQSENHKWHWIGMSMITFFLILLIVLVAIRLIIKIRKQKRKLLDLALLSGFEPVTSSSHPTLEGEKESDN